MVRRFSETLFVKNLSKISKCISSQQFVSPGENIKSEPPEAQAQAS